MKHRGRGGDRKSGKSYGRNHDRYPRVCLWCGVSFRAARPEAKTCGGSHRVMLCRYVKKHGKPPMFPFGLKPDRKPSRGGK